MKDNTFAVIMAGGRGERFWPLSTSKRPKQVLALVGGKPMIQMAVERLEGLIPPERTLVITSADLVDVTLEAAPQLPRENVIGEPFGRDTAAAVALASAIVGARCPGAAFCILTADHVIRDLDVFRSTLAAGLKVALDEDVLLTIGINPTYPSTGYGYIEAGDECPSVGHIEFRRASRFVEKPDEQTATEYLTRGNYFWNSGMFIWSVASVQAALGRFCPELMQMAAAMTSVVDTPAFDSALECEYGKLNRISIDYALMEKADNIRMARGAFRWYDVGSWPALDDHFDSDEAGNTCIGRCEVLDSSNNIVVSDQRMTALIGVEDLVVVQGEGATLVCHRDRAQDVKALVTRLREIDDYADLL